MTMDRRTFLRGALIITAAAALPKGALKALIRPLPVLYGDGVGDDTDALTALFNGKPFRTADGFAGTALNGELRNGNFLLTRTLVIDNPDGRIMMQDNRFTCTSDFEPILDVKSAGTMSMITGNWFAHPAHQGPASPAVVEVV